jgi:hypothetical protein
MTPTVAFELLARIPKIPIDADELIGYEMLSNDINPTDAFSVIALLGMVRDLEGYYSGRKLPYKIAESPNGTLTVWALPPEPLPQ